MGKIERCMKLGQVMNRERAIESWKRAQEEDERAEGGGRCLWKSSKATVQRIFPN
jgi:hypothetical protein